MKVLALFLMVFLTARHGLVNGKFYWHEPEQDEFMNDSTEIEEKDPSATCVDKSKYFCKFSATKEKCKETSTKVYCCKTCQETTCVDESKYYCEDFATKESCKLKSEKETCCKTCQEIADKKPSDCKDKWTYQCLDGDCDDPLVRENCAKTCHVCFKPAPVCKPDVKYCKHFSCEDSFEREECPLKCGGCKPKCEDAAGYCEEFEPQICNWNKNAEWTKYAKYQSKCRKTCLACLEDCKETNGICSLYTNSICAPDGPLRSKYGPKCCLTCKVYEKKNNCRESKN